MADVLFLQLPVPETVPHRLTGNIPLGAATLVLHARRSGVAQTLEIAPPEVANRYGDLALLTWIRGRAPKIVCLTCTVWNVERSMALAAVLPALLPGVQVWVGGPDVAPGSVIFREPRVFDVAVMGEGEETFVALLSGVPPESLPGVVTRQGPVGRVPARTLASLDAIHDPFLEGLVRPEADGVVPAEFWRGCIHGCLFCRYNQGRRGAAAGRSLPLVAETLRWCLDRGASELYLLDPSLEQRPDLEDLLALMARTSGGRLPVFAELRADAVTPALAGALKAGGVTRVETGLQTLTPEALRLAARPTDPARFADGMEALLGAGIDVKVDLMLGLPGDSPEAYQRTLEFLTARGFAKRLQVFVTQVLPGTGLRNAAKRLGLDFDAQPPYLLHSAPGWPEGSLQATMKTVERDTGVAMWDVEPPVLQRPRWPEGPVQQTPCPDSDAVLQYAFDLGSPEGQAAAQTQRFQRASCSAVLWLRCQDWDSSLALVPPVLQRFLQGNPFAALTVVLEHPPHWPLDLHDRLLELLPAHQPSLYLDRMLTMPSPHRRLFSALPADLHGRLEASWLEDLRGLAELLWLLPPGPPSTKLLTALTAQDYALVGGPGEVLPGATLAQLAALPDAHQIVLDGAANQWAWLQRLDRAAGVDW